MAHSPITIAIVILLVYSLSNLVSSDTTDFNPRSFTCTNTKNTTVSYQNNINILFSDFNSQSSLKGYYNTSTGDSPDKVFGYYMCRGDLKPQTCQNCITNATQFAQKASCDHQDGVFLSPKCIFQYTNDSIYGSWGRFGSLTSPLGTNLSIYQKYNQTLSSTMDALINEAAFDSSNRSSVLGFVTKEANVTEDEKIYSLAQCTPDIVGVNCSLCLRNALSNIQSFYESYKGAQISTANCLLIYNNQSFYDLGVVKVNEDDSAPPNLGVVNPNVSDLVPPNLGVLMNPNNIDGLRPPNLVVVYSALILFMYYTYLI